MEEKDKHKLFEGEAFQESSEEELKAFNDLAKRAGEFAIPKGKSKDTAWNDVLNKIDQQEKKSKKQPILWVAAVSAMLIAISYFFLYQTDTSVSAGNGELVTIDLPCGSKVTLNAGSTISYDEHNWMEERIINLSGQARFEVMEGTIFKVISDHGVVTVLGTVFEVFDRKSKYVVGCEKGRVKVQVEEQIETLKAGQGARLTNARLFAGDIDVNSLWIKGEYYYSSEPLGNVLNEIERQFDVKILRPYNIDFRSYEGVFTNKNLETALQMVLLPMDLSYQVKEKEVHITSNE